MLLLAEERVAQCGFAAMWGRLLTCGRLLIGLPGIRRNVWLRRCRSAGRPSCLTIRRDSQRNEDLVVQASCPGWVTLQPAASFQPTSPALACGLNHSFTFEIVNLAIRDAASAQNRARVFT